MKSPMEDIIEKLKNPDNMLTEAQRNNIKNLTGNVENVVKASLINLLMGQFTKITAYESAIGEIVKRLADVSKQMDTDELISLLSVLTKATAVESKSVLDLFKKNDNNVGRLLKEVQKITKITPSMRDDSDEIINNEEANMNKLSLEKKEKLLQMLENMKENKEMDSE